MRVALIEPYFGGSHKAFAEGLARFSQHEVEMFTHPASFWKWRMQGAFSTLARRLNEAVETNGRFDLVLGSSMLDGARFLGAARRAVVDCPFVFYMHENQLTYPPVPGESIDLSYAMTNWASMAVADLVVFNSEFHRNEWFQAARSMLGRFPDERHTSHVAAVERTSLVLAPGIDLARIEGEIALRRERPLILWNQRWAHDKGPDLLVAAMLDLADLGVEFDLALSGEQFVSDPTGFHELRNRLGDRVVHFGYAAEDEYLRLLRDADIVVSTSRQEFFGIAVTEAIYAGAFPVLPQTLVYPERLPTHYHDQCLYTGPDDLVQKLKWATNTRDEAAAVAKSLKPVMAAFDWSVMAPKFDALFNSVVGE
jgi:glycosyltransferase involved in cell wall biosynthesis